MRRLRTPDEQGEQGEQGERAPHTHPTHDHTMRRLRTRDEQGEHGERVSVQNTSHMLWTESRTPKVRMRVGYRRTFRLSSTQEVCT